MERGDVGVPSNGRRNRRSQNVKRKGPARRVKHTLALGSLVAYSKTVDERFDDLDVVHVEQHHPIPRWWWITTALMAAVLMTGVRWLAGKIGLA